MKKAKKLYILLGVFLFICLMTYLVSRQEEQKEKIKNSDEVILKIDKSDVEKLSWEIDSTKLSFHKKDGTWVYEEDKDFPVNDEKIENLLEQFESFGVSFEIEKVKDYGQYGLKNPACLLYTSISKSSASFLLATFPGRLSGNDCAML